jgi:protein-tyrosine-phosphatase
LSAGIAVNELIVQRHLLSRKLKDVLDQRSVGYIGQEFGVDVSERERQQLVPAMLDEADRVIVIAEKEQWPDFLQEGGKVVFWDIPDAVGQPDEFAYNVFRQVQHRVERLVEEIG